MKTIIIETALLACLFVSIVTKAQNPYITRADIIANFDISPDKKQLCFKWWGADAMFKTRVKKMSTQKILDIDSVNLKKTTMPSEGISFLSDNLILIEKNGAVFSYDIKSHKYSKLFDLPSLWRNSFRSFAVTGDKKGIYLFAYRNIYYANLQSGIRDSICLNKGAFVTDISATANNQVIYGTRESEKDKNVYQIWSWDGQNQPVNMTDQFSNLIEVPYLVEATSNSDLYIVANTEGVYRFDISTQKATKLIDNDKEDPVIMIRVSADNKTIYYLTAFHRTIIETMDMDGRRGEAILF